MCISIELPEFTVLPDHLTEVDDGADVRLSCAATGAPPPTICWEAVNVSVSNFIVTENNELLINDIVTANSGIYVCKAKNIAGTVAVYSEISSSVPS